MRTSVKTTPSLDRSHSVFCLEPISTCFSDTLGCLRQLPLNDRVSSYGEPVQGFPDGYIFAGTRSSQPAQVANAVPPPLAEAPAMHLRQYLQE